MLNLPVTRVNAIKTTLARFRINLYHPPIEIPIPNLPRIGRVERMQIRSSDMWGHGTTMERRAMTFFIGTDRLLDSGTRLFGPCRLIRNRRRILRVR